MTQHLLRDGYQVEMAGNGQEALTRLLDAGRAGTPFDLVITDRAMPEMSGDQLAAAVKRALPATGVIMLTGFAELMNAEGQRPEGVDLVLAKPANLEQLRSAVTQLRGKP
jgi:CheY-like chemotaxis protein